MDINTQVLCLWNTFQRAVVYGIGTDNWFALIGNADDRTYLSWSPLTTAIPIFNADNNNNNNADNF